MEAGLGIIASVKYVINEPDILTTSHYLKECWIMSTECLEKYRLRHADHFVLLSVFSIKPIWHISHVPLTIYKSKQWNRIYIYVYIYPQYYSRSYLWDHILYIPYCTLWTMLCRRKSFVDWNYMYWSPKYIRHMIIIIAWDTILNYKRLYHQMRKCATETIYKM